MDPDKFLSEENPTFFTGWRPLLGWISVFGLSIQFILIPIVGTIASLSGHEAPLPTLDIASLVTLTTSVLGLGGLRTIEKINGVAS